MPRDWRLIPRALLLGVAVSLSATANAQTAAQPPAQKPGAPAEKPSDVPTSKKLNKNDGVIKPPGGIDPQIHQAPPETTGDKMPVIVPPGEPGGDQSIQPK